VSQVNLAGKNLVDYDYKDVEYMAKVRRKGWCGGKGGAGGRGGARSCLM